MSDKSKARRKAHREAGRAFKEGKLDEAATAVYKAAEEKRVAKLPTKK